ncbi:AlpA family transcriptional regulator [Pseudidiomarina sp. CB1]|uniref:helix-turn-helix transcriptional regulator n=1 Tax=Pseudidiomarina sp. CB1 TaxID=2972484 RepID=UPI002161EEB8|nr:AlpA family phage regulatory protein [Pseudidiomarina sp. CB1]
MENLNQAESRPNRILRIHEVVERTGLSKSYVYALSAKGKFPKRIILVKGGKAVGWSEREIEQWISSRIEEIVEM